MMLAVADCALAAGHWQPLLPSQAIEIDADTFEASATAVRGLTRQHATFEGSPPLTIYQRLRGDCEAGTLFSEGQAATNADGTPRTSWVSAPMALTMTPSNGYAELLGALCSRRGDGATLQGDTKQPGARPAGSFVDRASEKAIGGAVLGGAVALIFALTAAGRRMLRRLRAAVTNSSRGAVGAPASGVANASLQAAHPRSHARDVLYIQAMDELDDGRRDKATWARALASSDGNQGKAKANYIMLRVAQLQDVPPTK
jgi:hypothetical protein